MRPAAQGLLAMAGAATIWGLSGLYYKALAHVPPLEVLSHRTLWSVAFFGIVLGLQGRLGSVRGAVADRAVLRVLAVSAVMISLNWLGFIHAVQSSRALEASLGYYVFPLVAVAVGYLVLGERFTPVQSVAIALAAVAVGILTVGLGVPPWTALLLASTFGVYGLVKKRVALGPVLSVFIETLLLAPLALVWLIGVDAFGWIDIGGRAGGHFGRDWTTSALLVASGPLTGGPLVLFSYAARRISYALVGLVQYLNPTLQFLVAVMVFGEPFTRWHATAFPMIWAGLILYSAAAWLRERKSNRATAIGGRAA